MESELIEQIMMAHDKMLKENGRPQVVVLNDVLFEKESVPVGEIPMVCGMKVMYSPMPKHVHFIIKESFTRADRIRSLSDEDLARYLSNVEMYAHEHGVKNAATWLQKLQKEWGA